MSAGVYLGAKVASPVCSALYCGCGELAVLCSVLLCSPIETVLLSSTVLSEWYWYGDRHRLHENFDGQRRRSEEELSLKC